ncbi:MAG: hypothetical protein CVV64_10995 [Candidatus Wallbacteria bacterium HGW-Wallbacteria-1]|jgi:hypothetical protein|uniref:Uncharacterized protein n=1 Tax=Candidatus Wallbacteria bacterium HGW-Wallbacteria-1 TaxID=2013854 RepID=A0A2N1PPI0_9BACT|nr:MAG: hypothetical protein CVV64_10995 [Candidatus Wallbacteria bacterium HGW-Wallbacteria-1]
MAGRILSYPGLNSIILVIIALFRAGPLAVFSDFRAINPLLALIALSILFFADFLRFSRWRMACPRTMGWVETYHCWCRASFASTVKGEGASSLARFLIALSSRNSESATSRTKNPTPEQSEKLRSLFLATILDGMARFQATALASAITIPLLMTAAQLNPVNRTMAAINTAKSLLTPFLGPLWWLPVAVPLLIFLAILLMVSTATAFAVSTARLVPEPLEGKIDLSPALFRHSARQLGLKAFISLYLIATAEVFLTAYGLLLLTASLGIRIGLWGGAAIISMDILGRSIPLFRYGLGFREITLTWLLSRLTSLPAHSSVAIALLCALPGMTLLTRDVWLYLRNIFNRMFADSAAVSVKSTDTATDIAIVKSETETLNGTCDTTGSDAIIETQDNIQNPLRENK